MPQYRIVSEPDPSAQHREVRGAEVQRRITIVEAGSLAEAAYDARDTSPHAEHRITSVEELHPGVSYTDERITQGLTSYAVEAIEPELNPQFHIDDKHPLCESNEFLHTIREVVAALRDSDLVPGLDISVLDNEHDEPYAMVEVYDNARDIYLSHGTELRRLTDDRNAIGWDSVLAIARELIRFTNDLH